MAAPHSFLTDKLLLRSAIILTAVLAIISGIPFERDLLGASSNEAVTAKACENRARRGMRAFEVNDGAALCLYGPIDKEMLKQVSQIGIHDSQIVVLRSLGGDVGAALNVANRLFKANARLVVQDFCISSCANYLFLAGHTKTVLHESFVGFHGGPSLDGQFVYEGPPELYQSALDSSRARTRQLITEQEEFFRLIGVDPDLIYTAPTSLSPNRDLWSHQFWEYGPSELKRFGVEGVNAFWTPAQRSITDMITKVYWTVHCSAAGHDAWVCNI